MRQTLMIMSGAVALWGCGPIEFRIDENQGIPAAKGSIEVTLGAFTCGQPITEGGKTVTTRAISGGCEFTFDDTVEVVRAQDYGSIPQLGSTTNLVRRVELTIKALTVSDSATGTVLDLSTRVTSVDLSVNGQAVADKTALVALPRTVSLSGAALDSLKAKVDARQPASVAVRAVVVLPTTPALPAKLKVDYDAQPAIIIGSDGLSL